METIFLVLMILSLMVVFSVDAHQKRRSYLLRKK